MAAKKKAKAKKKASSKKKTRRRRSTPPPDKTTRSDLVCQEEGCDKTFEGKIGETICPDCVKPPEETSPADMPDQTPTLAEQEKARDEKAGKPYEKQVHVDPNRKRTDWSERGRGVSTRAAMDQISKEDEAGKARKDPLRDELREIDSKIDAYETEIARLKERRGDLLIELRPKQGEMDKDVLR